MPSRQWDYFMKNFFGDHYVMWHDGIDATSVCSLEGAERAKAEEMLIKSMKKGSQWAPMGLRELRSQKSIPIMKEMLIKSEGDLLLQISIALNTIEDTTEYHPHIIRVLKHTPSAYTRLKAARELRNFPTPEVIATLFDSMNDEDYLVRSNAFESLLVIHGFKPVISEHKEILDLLMAHPDEEKEINSKDAAAAYKKAEEKLRILFDKERKS